MNNIIRVEVETKSSVEEILSIISIEDLNICMELCLDHKFLKFWLASDLSFMRNVPLIRVW